MADNNFFFSRKFVLLRLIFLFLTLFMNTALSDFLPSILWATYNPFFSKLGDSPRTVFLKDTVYFVCPNTVDYPVQSTDEFQNNKLHANIYRVDKQGYDNCNSNGGFEIRICNDPNSVLSKKVIIFETVPNLSFPKFLPGEEYYFIDTSDGSKENASSRVGGKCLTHNMKMKMYVCANNSDPACPHGNKVTNGGWSSWGPCSNAGIMTRQCNNPSPSNGGNGCQGNATKSCLVATPSTSTTTTTASSSTTEQSSNNNTVTPQKGTRTSNSNSLGSLSVGAVVAIFLTIIICSIIIGILLGLFLAKTKLKNKSLKFRRKKQEPFTVDHFNINDLHDKSAVDRFNRSSVASTAKMRPFSTVSNDTTLTNVTGFTSYNDIYDQVNKDEGVYQNVVTI